MSNEPLPESIHPQGSRDTRLIERAVRQRWPITDKIKNAVVQRQFKTLLTTTSNREATQAARSLMMAEGQNQADEMAEEKQPEQLLIHNETTINYNNISLEDLERIEKELEQLAAGEKAVGGQAGSLPQEPI